MKVIYQKRNGEIIERIRSTYCGYRVGETTGMGWKVLDIKYPYKDKYYSYTEYNNLIDKDWKKAKKKSEIKRHIKDIFKSVNEIIDFIFILKLIFIILNKGI